MSVQQYLRKASLIVGAINEDDSLQDENDTALDLSELRFRFSVQRGDTQTPNSADIRVYNVSNQTANRIRQLHHTAKQPRLILQAGYGENSGILFDGQIMQVRRGRESPTDTYLDITAADGDRAYNFSTVAISMAANSSSKDHVRAVLARMVQHGIQGANLPASFDGNKSLRGRVLFGMCRDELRELARETHSNWSIQDSQVCMIPEGTYLEHDIPVITAATGMVGMPEQTPSGIKVRMLLNPLVRIGSCIRLDNSSIQQYRYSLTLTKEAVQNNFRTANAIKTANDGLYYVMVAEHQGDTRGNEWYTDVICVAGDAMVPESLKYRITAPKPGPSIDQLLAN